MTFSSPVIIGLITGLVMFNCIAGAIWFALKRKQWRSRRKHTTVGTTKKGPATLKNPDKYKESPLCDAKLHSQQYMPFRLAVLSRPMPPFILNIPLKLISGPPASLPRPFLFTGSTVSSLQRRFSSRSIDSVSVYSTASAPLELHEVSASATIRIPPGLPITTQMTPFTPSWARKIPFRMELAPETYPQIHRKARDLNRGNIYDPAITFERVESYKLNEKSHKKMLLTAAPFSLRPSISRQTGPLCSAGRQRFSPLSPLSHLPSPYSPPQKYKFSSSPTPGLGPC